MNATPKTIQIFLPSGDPRGIRIAEITTRIVQVIEVPRSLLQDFLKMDESNQVSLYFLFGDAGDGSDPSVYIGQTGDLRTRLVDHNQKKDFWQRALVLISRTNSLTQTHALFLEWHSLQAARKAGRYADENRNSGSKPHTPAPLEADCHEIFDTGRTLLATLGYPLFEAVATSVASATATSNASNDTEEAFFLKSKGTDARGLYTPEGFVVLQGSTGRRSSVPSIVGTSDERFRDKLIEAGVMEERGEHVVFPKDHLFRSPSMAAVALLGRVANGWLEWKRADGATLHALKRANVEAPP
jgi:hypothetical protein